MSKKATKPNFSFFVLILCCCMFCYACMFDLVVSDLVFISIFTARCYASAVLAVGLCLCLCPSVTSRSSTKTAKRRITQTTPHDTSGTLVFDAKDLREIRRGSPPAGAPNAGGGGSKSATFD